MNPEEYNPEKHLQEVLISLNSLTKPEEPAYKIGDHFIVLINACLSIYPEARQKMIDALEKTIEDLEKQNLDGYEPEFETNRLGKVGSLEKLADQLKKNVDIVVPPEPVFLGEDNTGKLINY